MGDKQMTSDDIASGMRLVRELIARDRLSEALKKCDDMLALEPESVDVVMLKAWILTSPVLPESKPEVALRLLQTALSKHPQSAELHAAVAYVHETGLARYDRAAEEYRYAIGLNPQSPSPHLALALLLGAPGSRVSIDEARRVLEEATSRYPEDWQIRRQLGLVCWQAGDVVRAEREFLASLRAIPKTEAYSRKQLKDWARAIASGMRYEDGFVRKVD